MIFTKHKSHFTSKRSQGISEIKKGISFEMKRKVLRIKIKRPFLNETESALTFHATQHNSHTLTQLKTTHTIFYILECTLPAFRDLLVYCQMGRAGVRGCIEQQASIRTLSYHHRRWCTDTSGYDNTAPDWEMGGVWGDQPSWYRLINHSSHPGTGGTL